MNDEELYEKSIIDDCEWIEKEVYHAIKTKTDGKKPVWIATKGENSINIQWGLGVSLNKMHSNGMTFRNFESFKFAKNNFKTVEEITKDILEIFKSRNKDLT